MSLISVTGFPYALHETIVGFRSPGQSKTCLEKGSRLVVQNDEVKCNDRRSNIVSS